MNALTQPSRQGVGEVWAALLHGWPDLRERARGALTRLRQDGKRPPAAAGRPDQPGV